MKIVINTDYGSYGYWGDRFGGILEKYKNDRSNPELVELVEHNNIGDLAVVEIPDGATDWSIEENDGYEYVYYVLNGKIYHKEYEEEEYDDEEEDE